MFICMDMKGVTLMSEYKSRVYTELPAYADYDSAAKFQALEGIIITRLTQHPNAICSYSGGSDSDILINLIERTRQMFNNAVGHEALKPVKYVFFNTGLEMKATKDHVKATAEKYGVEIEECRPKINIVKASREYGIPFLNKHFSQRLSDYQKRNVPMSIVDEYKNAEKKSEKYHEIVERYPNSKGLINFLLGTDKNGEYHLTQLALDSEKYLKDFLQNCPPCFKISAKCCDYCKKQLAHQVQKGYDMVITGERMAEGGIRATSKNMLTNPLNTMCFFEQSNGQHRFRPLFYVSDKDKEWYKREYGIKYSDAYEVYGLTRTGCCGCSISHKAVEDLEKIRPYEPNVVKAAYNLFGKSYEYRRMYNEYKAKRMAEEKTKKQKNNQQLSLFAEKER